VRSFFLKTEHASAMRSGDDFDVIPGEVAEITFQFRRDKLQSLSFDCSL
jgi:hypothetical protein